MNIRSRHRLGYGNLGKGEASAVFTGAYGDLRKHQIILDNPILRPIDRLHGTHAEAPSDPATDASIHEIPPRRLYQKAGLMAWNIAQGIGIGFNIEQLFLKDLNTGADEFKI